MNPDDFLSIASTFSNFNKYDSYLTTNKWLDCGEIYNYEDDITRKSNYIFIKFNYIGECSIYIERPNCEDLINIKKLNPTILTGNDLVRANYISSFDDNEPEKENHFMAFNNIEELKIWDASTSIKISEEEFHLMISDKKFRTEKIKNCFNSIFADLLERLKNQIRNLELNPNIYHEKLTKIMDDLPNHFEVEIVDSFEDKLAIINPKTYEIKELSSYSSNKTDDYFVEDLLYLVAEEFALVAENEDPTRSFKRILDFLRESGFKDLVNKTACRFNEMHLGE
jgi:hypothetical protein